MALTIYGTPRSRTLRVLWMAAELGLDYRHVPLAVDDPWLKSPAFLALNPAGAVPTIVDDDFALSESLAINLYLAKRYGLARLYPETAEGEAQVWRWSLWAQGQLEPWVMRDARLADLRGAMVEHTQPEVARSLATLDLALAERPWLLGEAFTVADLNVAAVLSPSRAEHLDLKPHPKVAGWLARCYARPAAIATRRRFASPPGPRLAGVPATDLG
jgi:glutathione S-transferase